MNDGEAIVQIAEIIQSSLAVNGQLAFPFYKQFWANLHESPESAACYLAVLLSKLVGMTSGEDKYTPLPDLVLKVVADTYSISASDMQKVTPDADPTLLALRQSILLTLFFIGIHVRFAVVHPCMNLAFAKWIEFNAIQRWINAKTPFVDEVISILTSSFDNEESLSQIIEDATTIDVPIDLCHDLDDAHTLSRALLSAWLVRGSSFPLPKLIGVVLDVLKKDNVPESRVLVVLHMLKKLVLHTPYISHATVHSALSLLKPYYLWPRPYGDYAREVMQILSSEARNPGHSLRSMILREFPNVVRDHPKIKYARPATHGRVIHMLVDTLHNDGSIMHDLLKSSPADDPSPAQLQYDLLGNVLYRVLGIEGDILGVEHCPPDLISELLAEALTVMDHAATLPEKDARTFRLQHIKAIRERIMEKAEFDSYAYPPRHPVPPPFHMSIIQLKCTNARPRKSDDLTDSHPRLPLRKNCVQSLAQIFSSYQNQNRSQTTQSGQPVQPNGNHSPPSNRRNHKSPPTSPNQGVPSHDSNTKSNRKSGSHQQSGTPSQPPPLLPVRIAVIGSDAALHTVVTGYVTLRREQPALFVGLDVRFYIVPVAYAPPLTITASLPGPLNSTLATNHFASFIAKNDPWYYRHIWVGTYSLMSILPSGSTSLSISQLQDLAGKGPSSLSQSPRQRAKSRALAVSDIDRLASSGSLVESLKAVQKQKFVANSFLTAKPLETEGAAGASSMVGNGRLSSSTELSKIDTSNRKDSGADDTAREDRNRKGSGGNKNVDTSTSNSNSDHSSVNPANSSNTTMTTTITNITPNITDNASNVTSTTTTVTTNLNGIQEIVISSSSTEVLVLKRSPKTQPTTNVSIATNSSNNVQSTPTTTPTSPSSSTTPPTSDTSPRANDTDSKMSRSSSWTTDAATAEGTRRNGSVGNSANPSPNKSRSRSNSGNSDANGIVVGQSRSRSSSNNPPEAQPNAYSLNKSSSANSIEKRTSDPPKPETQNTNITSTNTHLPTTSAPKAIFRRSNSLSDGMATSAKDDGIGRAHFTNKGGLQHAHSVAEFNYEPNAQDPSPTSLPSSDAPSSVLQAPSPARILRQEFDTFVRDATQYLNVAVFQAECWTIVDNESMYFTVPFLIRAELGISAYTRFFAESNDLPTSFTHQDITSHKLFKYTPIPLALKCTPVNLNGVARSVLVSEPKPYTSISLSNFGPLDKAQQNNANPTRPWLELSTVEAESKKKRREESHTHYVNIVDIETEGKKLVDVLLDGEYYGGVYKLRITTCTAPLITRPTASSTPPSPYPTVSSSPASPSLPLTPAATEEEQIVFPVMTYLPLNLP
eukprot:Phypoly_transcript_00659.p1 GENE.Phypoly_transcript_00659~~Phypoly_transcript_00659.p1  ORF type:complete len:1330 (+),score=180.08 Phypoly_transcript_00659:190-4179(+)